jgi:hypothetical protein
MPLPRAVELLNHDVVEWIDKAWPYPLFLMLH